MGDVPVAEISDNKQKSQDTDIYASGGIRTRNPSKQAAADPRLRPHDHRDRLSYRYSDIKIITFYKLLGCMKRYREEFPDP